jgi:predicted HD superfamily hydrolase involved in NAD metabolism
VLKRVAILKKLKEVLGRSRYAHSLRVEKTALALARRFGVDQKKAGLAALLHDYARQFDRPGLLREAKKFKLRVDPVSRSEPKLLHAELSALMAKKDFGVKSKAVLEAIKKHTIGSPEMTDLEKIIYLADHIEEGRNFGGVGKVRRLAFKNMDQAIAVSTSNMLGFLLKKGLPVHPGTVSTRNYYLLRT